MEQNLPASSNLSGPASPQPVPAPPQAVPPNISTQNPKDTKPALLIILVLVIILLILGILFFDNIKGVFQPKTTPEPTTSQENRPKRPRKDPEPTIGSTVVCFRFTEIDHALKRPDVACVLDLSNKGLTALPSGVSDLPKLETLSLAKNNFSQVPDQLTANLGELNLSDNQISTIPDSISGLAKLRFLDLSNNRLTTLPSSISSLTQLQTLVLKGNQISNEEQQRIKGLLPNTTIQF